MPKYSKSQVTIPTFLGILFLVLGIAAGVLLVQSRQEFRSRASDPPKPKGVTITNITDSSFTVSWTTDESSTGFVAWGESEDNYDNKTESGPSSLIQSMDVSNLNPESTYYFQVFVNDKPYLNDSVPWQVTTSRQLPPPSKSLIASGTILNPDGTKSSRAIVYLDTDSGSTRSTLTSDNGRWIIPISEMRDSNLNSYVNIDEESTLINLVVTDGTNEGFATVRPIGSNPTPDITLGESYDFSNNSSESQSFQNPEADVSINQSKSQSDEVTKATVSPTTTPEELDVEIISIEEDEIVKEVLPKFSGVGKPNLELTITVESDPITETVTVGEDGSWSWLPPVKLEDGLHTITITYLDANGVIQSIKREFTVNASGSENITNTPTPFPTSRVTSTPRPTSTPTAALTVTPTSQAQLPDTGMGQNSVLLFGFFVTTIALSLLILLI